MTTLQLARAIATAVLRTRGRHRDSRRDPPTQAVLRALEDHDAWFMHVRTDDDGAIARGSERPFQVQRRSVSPYTSNGKKKAGEGRTSPALPTEEPSTHTKERR